MTIFDSFSRDAHPRGDAHPHGAHPHGDPHSCGEVCWANGACWQDYGDLHSCDGACWLDCGVPHSCDGACWQDYGDLHSCDGACWQDGSCLPDYRGDRDDPSCGTVCLAPQPGRDLLHWEEEQLWRERLQHKPDKVEFIIVGMRSGSYHEERLHFEELGVLVLELGTKLFDNCPLSQSALLISREFPWKN